MAKYRKKPVIIDAEQFWPNQKPWPEGVYEKAWVSQWDPSTMGDTRVAPYGIATLEGTHEVSPGDFIITGIKGEKYPCKESIFWLTYDILEEEPMPKSEVEVEMELVGQGWEPRLAQHKAMHWAMERRQKPCTGCHKGRAGCQQCDSGESIKPHQGGE